MELIKFPETNLAQNRINSALKMLQNSSLEYQAVLGIVDALGHHLIKYKRNEKLLQLLSELKYETHRFYGRDF